MKHFNTNNPTEGWTEDEKYDFCKMENKWIKELPTGSHGRKIGLVGTANDPVFSSVEEINIAFENDILRRKETWKHLCHICDYATNKKVSLTRHLFVHGIGERFKCDKCEKDFAQKSSLKEHRESHNSSSGNKCNQCGKFYKTQRILEDHISTMHSAKHLQCDQCEMMFSNLRRLNGHKRQVHVFKSFKCDQCQHRAKTKVQLKLHIKYVHDGHLREISTKCDLCDYQGTKQNLKSHKEAIHENKKNWFCKACPFSTYSKGSFQRHMRIHTGEKPYQCQTCHKNFSNHFNAKRHCKS